VATKAARPLNFVKLVLDYLYLISLAGFVKGITAAAGCFGWEQAGLTLWGRHRARIGKPGMSAIFVPASRSKSLLPESLAR
jgi:hypothetical protein